MPTMTTAEAIVAGLIAHGLDTIYALPGLQNDHLFDALFKASDRIRTIHTRHEQGAAYMALGAALATGARQAFAVVPGPGLLNASAALLTAYSMNAPVVALIGQIPERDIGRNLGQLHEINDQAGIIDRLVGEKHAWFVPHAKDAPRIVAQAFRAMATGRPGPAALECPINVWGKPGNAPVCDPLPVQQPAIDEDALRDAAKRLAAAKNPMIVVGGGAQDASPEVTTLAELLQAPVLCGFRRGQGVLDSRNPLAVTLPLGRELWAEADVLLAVGTRLFFQHTMWGVDDDLAIIAVNADPEEPAKHRKPAVELIGDAAPILRRLIEVLPTTKRKTRTDEMNERQAKWRKRLSVLAPQLAILEAIRAELPEDGIFVDEVTQVGFAARIAMPVYKPRTFLSPGYQDNLGWGYATALGAQSARRDAPVLSINGDGGFMYTANELATAMRHRIPLVAVVFSDGSFGNVRRIQEESYGNRLIASDLANPDFVKFGESFGAAAERVRTPEELRGALRRGFSRRDGPTLIEMPVGPMPSPWEFILMGKVRG